MQNVDAIVKARANAFASCNVLGKNRNVAVHKLAEHWRNQCKEFVRRAKEEAAEGRHTRVLQLLLKSMLIAVMV